MQQPFTISLGKLVVYIAIVCVIIFAVKKFSFSGFQQSDLFAMLYQSKQKNKRPVYFTGTSRTQCGVNDSLLNSNSTRFCFFNAGFGYGTFISSVAFANKVLDRIDSPVIFIELSIANGRMPATFSLVAEPQHMFATLWPLLQHSSLKDLHYVYGPFSEQYFFDFINLKPHLKIYKSNYKVQEFFGYLKKKDALKNNPGTFLLHNEVYNSESDAMAVPAFYTRMINGLLSKAERLNSRIIFTLPLCMSNLEEKKRLLAIYKNIPAANKLDYSSSFLRKINNPAYLADDIHLNETGAAIYTNYLNEKISVMAGD